MEIKAEIKSIDSILDNIVGGDGLWQWKIFSVVLIAEIYTYTNILLHTLTTFTPSHRCYIPFCDNDFNANVTGKNFFNKEWLEFAIPKTIDGKEFLKEESLYDQCHKFKRYLRQNDTYDINSNFVDDTCKESSFVKQIEQCEEFVVDREFFEETFTTHLNLVCENG